MTAADFVEFAQTTNDHIARCIGRMEGESVAAGLCRKFYLRCAPMINVLMCEKDGEVYSEAHKSCKPKSEVSNECNAAKSIGSRAISFSPNSNEDAKKEILDMSLGDTSDRCLGKPNGFYSDPSNCARILQVRVVF